MCLGHILLSVSLIHFPSGTQHKWHAPHGSPTNCVFCCWFPLQPPLSSGTQKKWHPHTVPPKTVALQDNFAPPHPHGASTLERARSMGSAFRSSGLSRWAESRRPVFDVWVGVLNSIRLLCVLVVEQKKCAYIYIYLLL